MRTLLPSAMALALFLSMTLNATSAHPPHVTRYIETYDEIAIQEMHRSGIPASVILAQGIHESSWGLGELSTNSNNHFGIKCKSIWNGPTYYIEDDDYQNGILVKSCFRVYNSVEESYIDHTNFLVDGSRYRSLFSYDKTDYKNWSKGLKSCGYATDPNYATKLIKTIEKYGLNKYDIIEKPAPQIVHAPVFHLPAPKKESVSETPSEIAIPSIIANALQPKPIAKEDIPAAVSIEDYIRNENKNNNTNAVSYSNMNTITSHYEEPIAEIIEVEAYEQIPTIVLQSPSYQLASASPPVHQKQEQPAKLSVMATDDSNLLLMRGKTRVKKTLRR